MDPKIVLVTGATGNVGGAVVEALRRSLPGTRLVGLGRREGECSGRIECLRGDIRDYRDLEQQVQGLCTSIDAVIHAAAVIPGKASTDAEFYEVNVKGTANVARLSRALGVSCFVHISSIGVIGIPTVLPVTERHPERPSTPYQVSKLEAEREAAVGSNAAILRISSPVGPRMRPVGLMGHFVQRARRGLPLKVFGSGSREQDYLDVRDLAYAIRSLLKAPRAGLYNIARGESISNLALAETCVRVLRSSSEVHCGVAHDPEDGLRWRISIEKAQSEIGFIPARSLEESIRSVGEYTDL